MTKGQRVLALIPARMGSGRFPGKPLALILGKPMLGHVYERVRACTLLDRTVVATCDAEILEYIKSIGGEAVLTSSLHERASDRCAEALDVVEREVGVKYDIVVMVQGDEPMIDPRMISEAVEPMFADVGIKVANLIAPVEEESEFRDANCIKVVCDLKGNALYFSREPIPTTVRGGAIARHKQVCVIPFRRDYLLEYVRLAPTPLEIAESVDMMRVLEHGGAVRMVPTQFKTHAVDIPADIAIVEELLRGSTPLSDGD